MGLLKQFKYLVIAAVVSAGLGCGIKGPPLPPIETVEDKVNSAPVVDSRPPTGPKTTPTSADTTIAIPPK